MSISNGTIIVIAAGVAAAITASGVGSLSAVAGGLTAAVVWVLGQMVADAVRDRRQRRRDEQAAAEREQAWVESRSAARPVIESEYSELF